MKKKGYLRAKTAGKTLFWKLRRACRTPQRRSSQPGEQGGGADLSATQLCVCVCVWICREEHIMEMERRSEVGERERERQIVTNTSKDTRDNKSTYWDGSTAH
jgi:hypothetical protein